MADVYRWLKWFGAVRSPRLKLLGLWLLHVTGRRYMGIFLDPVLACNLRCRMCYFSDAAQRDRLKGRMTQEEITALGRALFPRALKLQIGCGAEPMLCPFLEDIVRLGKREGVPHISLTTNGQLLDEKLLDRLAAAGLDELTLSAHGLTAATYERLMTGARFDRFTGVLESVRRIRERWPALRLRINYTLCADNVEELARFDEVVAPARPDVLQLRPIQSLGATAYHNFSLEAVEAAYDRVIAPLLARCRGKGITCLVPTRAQLAEVNQPDNPLTEALETLAYCNLSPASHWEAGFDWQRDTFRSYCRRTGRARHILSLALRRTAAQPEEKGRTKPLNYRVD